MKNLNSIQLEDSFKKNRIKLIISLVFLVISVSLLVFGIKNEYKKLPEAINLSELKEDSNELTHAYIDVSTKPYLFAAYSTEGVEEDSKFYLVMDSSNKLYVLYMSLDDYEKLNKDSIITNPVRVTGFTRKLGIDIKELAISSYNENLGDTYLTNDNFSEYMSVFYLDLEYDRNNSTIYYAFAFVSFLLFLILIIIYIQIFRKNKKIIKKYSKELLDKINSEIYSQKEKNPYSKMNLYLLKDYIVDISNGIVIVPYKDIVWAYKYEYRYNGLIVNKNIRLYDNKKKLHEIANTKYYNKDRDKVIEEILKKIKKKNSKIMLDYSKENKKIFKEKYKNKK